MGWEESMGRAKGVVKSSMILMTLTRIDRALDFSRSCSHGVTVLYQSSVAVEQPKTWWLKRTTIAFAHNSVGQKCGISAAGWFCWSPLKLM